MLPQLLGFAGIAAAELAGTRPAPWRPFGELWKHSLLLQLPQPAKEQKWKWHGNAAHSGEKSSLVMRRKQTSLESRNHRKWPLSSPRFMLDIRKKIGC